MILNIRKRKEWCKTQLTMQGPFEKETLGPGEDANLQVQKNMDWITEMKIKPSQYLLAQSQQ